MTRSMAAGAGPKSRARIAPPLRPSWKWSRRLALWGTALTFAGSACQPTWTEDDLDEEVDSAEQAIDAATNLALGKPTSQSSVFSGGVPGRAVDGNTNGNWGGSSVTHTNLEAQPWWQVDLQSSQPIGTVELWNRTDCCADRLSAFRLRVSEDGTTWQDYPYSGTAGSKVTFAVNRLARHVRVQLDGTNYLSLAEIRIFAAAPGDVAGGPLATQPTSPVGAVAGQFQVSPTGAATYEVPLQVPPGTRGVEPKLALTYRSSGGNGLVGVGWGLSGLPVIHRCPRTMAQDGVRGGVRGDGNDRLCLDGQRLIWVAAGGHYQTEIDTLTKVVPSGDCDGAPCSFQVTDKQGNVASFGATADSKPILAGGNRARLWALSRLTSKDGDYLTAQWTQSEGELYPQRIEYTMNAATPTLERRRVDFEYESRSDRESGWIGGSAEWEWVNRPATKVVMGRRLTRVKASIESAAGFGLVREYRLKYHLSPATARSLLDRIEECDGAGVCLPATTMAWNDAAGESFDVYLPSDPRLQNVTRYDPGAFLHLGDFDGDGKTDFLRQERGAWDDDTAETFGTFLTRRPVDSPAASPFDEIFPTDPTDPDFDFQKEMPSEPGAIVHVGDFNGDGRADFLRQEKGSWDDDTGNTFATFFSLGDGNFRRAFFPDVLYQSSLRFDPGARLILGDYNGDGKTDFIRQDQNGWAENYDNTFSVYFSLGDGQYNRVDPVGDWYQYDMVAWGAFIIPGDFDGDGKTDFMRREHGEWELNDENTTRIYFSNGNGYFTVVEPPEFANFEADLTNVIPGDYNGDGKTDFILQEKGEWDNDDTKTFRVFFSQGHGRFEEVQPAGDYQTYLKGDQVDIVPVDYNGDGKTDFLSREKNDWDNDAAGTFHIWVSRGDGTFAKIHPGTDGTGDLFQDLLRTDPGCFIHPGDFDGDGKTDFLRQEKGDLDHDANWTLSIYRAKGDRAQDTVKTFTNGLGGEIDVEYAPLTDPSIYTRNYPAPGASIEVAGATFVVKKYSLDDAAGHVTPFDVTYWSAKVDTQGRGSLGFASIKQTGGGSTRTTHYHQTFPLTGTVKRMDVSNGGTSRRETYRFLSHSSPSPGVYRVALDREEVIIRDGAATGIPPAAPSFTTVKEYVYDGFGNVALVRDKGLSSDPSDDVDTCTTHVNDTASWRFGFPSQILRGIDCSFTNGACSCATVLQKEERLYTATMNLAQEKQWDSANGVTRVATFTHDVHGNVLTRTVPGVVPVGQSTALPLVERRFYDADFHTFPVAEERAGGALVLASTLSYDPRFGLLVARTDPNGATENTQVDGLGRVVGTAVTSPSGVVTLTRRATWRKIGDDVFLETEHREDWGTDEWRWEREVVDGFGRVRRRESQGPDAGTAIRVDLERDHAGRVTKESRPYHTGDTAVHTTYSSDWLGRPRDVTSPDGSVTQLRYAVDTSCAGCTIRVTTTEAAGSSTSRLWTRYLGADEETVRLVDPQGLATSTTYDRLGRKSVEVGPGGSTSFSYDSLGNLISTVSTDRGTTSRTHDPRNGWLSRTTDATGQTIDYTYDGLGRVTQKIVTGKETVTFTYDQTAQANGIGRLTSASVVPWGQSQPSSTDAFAYSPDGQVKTRVTTVDGVSYAVSSAFDPQGRLRSFTYPDGSTLIRSYTPEGFLHQLKIGSVVHAEYDEYNAAGQPLQSTYANGTDAAYAYDPSNRLTAATTWGAADEKLLDYNYSWNALNQITQITDKVSSARTQTFQYSLAGRLTSATGVYGSLSYGYDPAGNLVSKEGQSFSYSGHRVVSGPSFSASYDAAGNRTQATRGADVFTYDHGGEGRLRKVTKNGAVVEQLSYDFAGQRLRKVDADGTRTLYLSPSFEVTFLPDGRRLETRYVTAPVGRVAALTTEFPAAGAALLQFRGLDSEARLYDAGTPAGLFALAKSRVRAWAAHPEAPIALSALFAMVVALGAIGLLRRRAPHVLARGLASVRAVLLPEKTELARRHPVFAWAAPLVLASFLSACSHGPMGGPVDTEGPAAETDAALVAGANGWGYPIAGAHYFHHNHLSSSSVVTNASGVEVSRAEYKPFGEIHQAASPGLDIFRAKLTGKEWDKDSGLYHFDARYYDPATGTFLTPDVHVRGGPEHLTSSLNPYAYAVGNPITYIDPSGHFAFFFVVLIGALVGAYFGGAAASGSYNPARWDWTSYQTWVGVAVGGLVGGLTAGVTAAPSAGFGTALLASFADAAAAEGLRFLSPEGSSLRNFVIGVALGVATGAAFHRFGELVGRAFNRGVAYVGARAGGARIASLVGATTWKEVAGATAMGVVAIGADIGMNYLPGLDDSDEAAAPPAGRLDASPVTDLVRSLADSTLRAAGADTPGRLFGDPALTSELALPLIPPIP